MHSLGNGTMHGMCSVLSGIVLASWQSPDYTLGEKFNMWRGKLRQAASVASRSLQSAGRASSRRAVIGQGTHSQSKAQVVGEKSLSMVECRLTENSPAATALGGGDLVLHGCTAGR
jgi:hypothetical protein